MRHAGLFTLGAAAFALLVILNAGGYRYGVSDQAFYLPAVLQQMVPDLYPHDAPLIAARDRLLLFDDWFAPLLERTNVSPPVGFLAAYAVTLSLLYFAIVGIGRVLYSSRWTRGLSNDATPDSRYRRERARGLFPNTRHLLACSIGLCALLACLRGRSWTAPAVAGLAALAHPTTGLWFGVWIGVAAIFSDGAARRVSRRMEALGDFNMLDSDRAVALADRCRLDYLITEHQLDLPENQRVGRFHVYSLTHADR